MWRYRSTRQAGSIDGVTDVIVTDVIAPMSVGVIGGSGRDMLFDSGEELHIETPYGPTSGPITVGMLGGRRVAFLPRQGTNRTISPPAVPFRANIWALARIGVTALITSTVAGGLRETFTPGTFVVTDQFVDRTTGRDQTFYDQGRVVQLATADPFDNTLRALAVEALTAEGVRMRDFGTAVVIPGPRFATRAESRSYAALGGDVVNMSIAPETPLALELGIAVVNLSFITANDSGVTNSTDDQLSAGLVERRIAAANPVIRRIIEAVARRIPEGFRGSSEIAADTIAEVLARPVR